MLGPPSQRRTPHHRAEAARGAALLQEQGLCHAWSTKPAHTSATIGNLKLCERKVPVQKLQCQTHTGPMHRTPHHRAEAARGAALLQEQSLHHAWSTKPAHTSATIGNLKLCERKVPVQKLQCQTHTGPMRRTPHHRAEAARGAALLQEQSLHHAWSTKPAHTSATIGDLKLCERKVPVQKLQCQTHTGPMRRTPHHRAEAARAPRCCRNKDSAMLGPPSQPTPLPQLETSNYVSGRCRSKNCNARPTLAPCTAHRTTTRKWRRGAALLQE
jgi:hypothetical protein